MKQSSFSQERRRSNLGRETLSIETNTECVKLDIKGSGERGAGSAVLSRLFHKGCLISWSLNTDRSEWAALDWGRGSQTTSEKSVAPQMLHGLRFQSRTFFVFLLISSPKTNTQLSLRLQASCSNWTARDLT